MMKMMKPGAPQLDRITWDPAQMNGQPCIRDMRLTVRRVLHLIAQYPDRRELFADHPDLEDEDLRQALAYVAASLEDEAEPLRVGSCSTRISPDEQRYC